MALDNQDMFAIYAAGIARAAGLPANPTNFILTGTALPANLAYGSRALPNPPSMPDALGDIYELADTLLYPQGIYDQSADSFFSNYATYIDNLVPQGSQKAPTPTQQGQVNLIKQSLQAANTQYTTDLNAASTAYTQASTLFPGQYPTFQSYLSQTAWGGTLNTDMSAVSGLNSSLSTLYSQIYGQDYVAIQMAKTTVDNVRMAMLGSSSSLPTVMSIANGIGTAQVVPDYDASSLMQFSTWVDSTIQQHGNTGEQPVTIGFSSSSATYDFSKSAYFSKTDWNASYWFWSAGGSSSQSQNQVNVDSNSSKFNIRMAFDAITTVQVKPGAWYDSSLMYAYPNASGLIRPTALLVAMYPTITLTMDATSFAQAQSAYNSSSGFGIGSFWASASTQKTVSTAAMTAQFDSSSNTVTMASQSIQPVVVGMLVTPLVS